jgi:hypothetical protein
VPTPRITTTATQRTPRLRTLRLLTLRLLTARLLTARMPTREACILTDTGTDPLRRR